MNEHMQLEVAPAALDSSLKAREFPAEEAAYFKSMLAELFESVFAQARLAKDGCNVSVYACDVSVLVQYIESPAASVFRDDAVFAPLLSACRAATELGHVEKPANSRPATVAASLFQLPAKCVRGIEKEMVVLSCNQHVLI